MKNDVNQDLVLIKILSAIFLVMLFGALLSRYSIVNDIAQFVSDYIPSINSYAHAHKDFLAMRSAWVFSWIFSPALFLYYMKISNYGSVNKNVNVGLAKKIAIFFFILCAYLLIFGLYDPYDANESHTRLHGVYVKSLFGGLLLSSITWSVGYWSFGLIMNFFILKKKQKWGQ